MALLLYQTLLRKSRQFGLNRIYLLSANLMVPLYFCLPSLNLTETPVYSFNLEAFNIKAGAKLIAEYNRGALEIWKIILISGISAGIIRLLYNLYHLRSLILGAKIEKTENNKIYRLSDSNDAFTFFGYIFIGDKIGQKDLDCVLEHETAHQKLGHSLDRLLSELLLIVLWFHPFSYLFKFLLTEVHEFQADKTVSDKYSLQYYGALLLQHAMKSQVRLLHRFSNHSSLLKKRIIMMKKKNDKCSALYQLISFAAITMSAWILNIEQVKAQMGEVPDKQPVYGNCSNVSAAETESCSMMNLITELSKNFNYPQSAKDAKIEGRVFAEFTVTKTGKVEDIKIKKSLHPDCDKEAVRVLSELKNWTPGQKNGKPVDVKLVLPVAFKLDS